MKIDANNEIARSSLTDKSTQKEATADTDFQNILKASVERSKEHPVKIQTPAQPNPLAAIRFTPTSPSSKDMAVERVDHLLDLLDHYRAQLADPKVSLRQIEPLLNTIAKEKEKLSGALDDLSNEDGLKDIVNRTLITASLEMVKFNRGDYISA